MRAQLAQELRNGMVELRHRLTHLRHAHRAHHPLNVIERRKDSLLHLGERMKHVTRTKQAERRASVERLRALLRTLGPNSAFERGYSITLDSKGRILRTAEQLAPGDIIRTRFADGEVESVVAKQKL
jgi:exodeoxyribonuclease VII large subunit